jgi:hypothetical protein
MGYHGNYNYKGKLNMRNYQIYSIDDSGLAFNFLADRITFGTVDSGTVIFENKYTPESDATDIYRTVGIFNLNLWPGFYLKEIVDNQA